jgi:hypothetical protein
MRAGYAGSNNQPAFLSQLGLDTSYYSMATPDEQMLYDWTSGYRMLLNTDPTRQAAQLRRQGGNAFWANNATSVASTSTLMGNLANMTALPTTVADWAKVYAGLAEPGTDLSTVMGMDSAAVGSAMRAYAKK